MHMIFSAKQFVLWIALICWLPVTYGGLPASIDGEPLPSLAPMLEQVLPSVVNIATRGRVQVQQNPFDRDPFFQYFFDAPGRQPRERAINSLGSGVIIDGNEGYVVTIHLVIANADEIRVRLHDGRSFEATLVGTDPEADIAIIQIPSENLRGIAIGSSEDLRVGDFVVAIGNPFGLGQTVTSGIVSAKERRGLGIEGYEDFIQTDASINQGNSGGALVDLHGQLVGINTAILGGRGGGNVGIGFAIPVDMAMRLSDQLVEYGEVRRGLLGVQVQDLTPELAAALQLDVSFGAIISRVFSGSAAADAGLQEEDVIISVDGRSIDGAADLRNVIGLTRAGEKVQVEFLRDGTLSVVDIEIRALEVEVSEVNLEGATLGESSENEMGVVVLKVEPGSKAAQAGLRAKDVILSINKVQIISLQDVDGAVAQNPTGLVAIIRRANSHYFLVIR